MRDLKHVYGAVNKESAETELLNLEEKWGEKYLSLSSLGRITGKAY